MAGRSGVGEQATDPSQSAILSHPRATRQPGPVLARFASLRLLHRTRNPDPAVQELNHTRITQVRPPESASPAPVTSAGEMLCPRCFPCVPVASPLLPPAAFPIASVALHNSNNTRAGHSRATGISPAPRLQSQPPPQRRAGSKPLFLLRSSLETFAAPIRVRSRTDPLALSERRGCIGLHARLA